MHPLLIHHFLLLLQLESLNAETRDVQDITAHCCIIQLQRSPAAFTIVKKFAVVFAESSCTSVMRLMQRVGGRGRTPRMGPYDMAYPPPPMMMGGRGPPDGFRPRFPGGRGGRGQYGGPDRFKGPGGRGPQGRGRGGPGPQQAVPAPPPPPPATAAPSAAAAAPMAASGVVPGQQGSQLTTAMLAAAPPAQQKQMLGERLFPLVQQLQPELAGKITGMLLEMDNSELLLLLESSEALVLKTDEAISVLRQHNALPEDVNLPADGDIE